MELAPGLGAAAIDSVRKTKVSKSLRDDYTALNLAAISYTMLHATAVGLGDTALAALAQRHLADYARAVMQIVQIIPDVVLAELRDDGELVQTGAAELVRQQTNEVWKQRGRRHALTPGESNRCFTWDPSSRTKPTHVSAAKRQPPRTIRLDAGR